ncbi:hypothetical protein DPMN_059869 [Dreissena polymorpha]|uniref:Uncharacterized protein n=1 Tax=Dreissena polymorpha TaxID=45954 RepID=A0A9D4C4Q8_DREPO|nr:hypothetical protein DPMN_059869 [Dreissena polymorpha]
MLKSAVPASEPTAVPASEPTAVPASEPNRLAQRDDEMSRPDLQDFWSELGDIQSNKVPEDADYGAKSPDGK